MISYLLPDATAAEKRLARKIGRLGKASWKTFPNGEEFMSVLKPPERAVVIGRSAPPAVDLFRTLLLIDTLRRSGTKDVTLVLPYYGYARQDRAVKPGDPVTARLIARQAAAAGAKRIVTLDLHSAATASGSPVPLHSAHMAHAFADRLKRDVRDGVTIVAPDHGAKSRASRFAARLGRGATLAWVEKKRGSGGRVSASGIGGKITGDTAVLVDDIVDTAGTVALAAALLRRRGFKRLYLCASHPVLSDDAVRRLRECRFTRILFSDSVPLSSEARRALNPVLLRTDAVLAAATRAAVR